MRETGRIKNFIQHRGFGFIARAGEADMFFHISDVSGLEDENQLRPGAQVSFEIDTSRHRPRAVDVRLSEVR